MNSHSGLVDVLDELANASVKHEHAAHSNGGALLWLPVDEEEQLAAWTQQLKTLFPLYVLMWCCVHLASIAFAKAFCNPKSSIPEKDKALWHNKVVSATHGLVAVFQGLYWLTATDEMQEIGSRLFIFLPINSHIEAIGAAYFVYDTIIMLLSVESLSPGFFWSVLAHHLLFIVAFASTLVFPCSLNATVFHFFQLTELSTIFLHLLWMFSKMQIQYVYLFGCTAVLLVTFVQRMATVGFIVFHIFTRLVELELWTVQAELPYGRGTYVVPYMTYLGVGCIGMVALNVLWFRQLVAKAKRMIERVQNGKTPTSDYDRPEKCE